MKNRMRKFVVAILLLGSFYVYADEKKASIVLDMRNVQHLPKNFRTTSYPVKDSSNINLDGLRKLHIAGSGQFSRLALVHALEYIPSRNVIIVDLRQESHGFLNANAVSWYGQNNASNHGLSPRSIEMKQYHLLQSLLDEVAIPLAEPTKNKHQIKKTEYLVHSVASENEVMRKLNVPYYRFYVQDHHQPQDEEVDRFVKLVEQKPKGSWLYFHCRAGRGRTSTFMLMYDIMQNAGKVSLKDMLKRQAAIGGKDLLQLPGPKDPKYKAAVERIAFIKKFHRYVLESKKGKKVSWMEWVGDASKNKNPDKADLEHAPKYCQASKLARNMTVIGNIM